ncbi:hypothetical protein BaRGS_00007195 [Batillaria attramentaria]|uniref:Uncharacterized protein n=1 Tax=Batillaria attramentaria TaxID=370345 RepID=A0ABD0LQH7_9CAEN
MDWDLISNYCLRRTCSQACHGRPLKSVGGVCRCHFHASDHSQSREEMSSRQVRVIARASPVQQASGTCTRAPHFTLQLGAAAQTQCIGDRRHFVEIVMATPEVRFRCCGSNKTC